MARVSRRLVESSFGRGTAVGIGRFDPVRAPIIAPPAPPTVENTTKRSKIWELNGHLHCSIIGTCLSTTDLRRVLAKLDRAPTGSSDHELHGVAVRLAGGRDLAAKLLNKALDARHQTTINSFAKARDAEALRVLWREAVERGEIPGAYWATLTHPAATSDLVKEAFGDVHMLSHLVGAANRADIRRLSELEAKVAGLQDRLERQQTALRDIVLDRDAKIRALGVVLASRVAGEPEADRTEAADEMATLRTIVVDLERRLAAETRRRGVAEARADATARALREEKLARGAAEREVTDLKAELEALEDEGAAPEGDSSPEARLDGLSLLYVGGRPRTIAKLRDSCSRLGGALAHHDGGKEQSPDLLAGMIAQADLVVFPVDCVSHDAALTVKRHCRRLDKEFVALRSAGVGSLSAMLRRIAPPGMASAGD